MPVIGFAVFGAAIVGVLVLVVRLGRSAATPAPPAPVAPMNRFGIGVATADYTTYAVSAMPAAPPAPVGSPFPPPAGSPFPPPAAGTLPPGAFPPGQPYTAAPAGGRSWAAPSPFRMLRWVISLVVLASLGVGAFRVIRNEVDPLTAPADLGGVPLANETPLLAPLVAEIRRDLERGGTRKPLVAAYAGPGTLYVLAGGRNQAYDDRAEVLADLTKELAAEPNTRLSPARAVPTLRGRTVDCVTVTDPGGGITACVWKHEDTAGVVFAFDVVDVNRVAELTAEAMTESGAV